MLAKKGLLAETDAVRASLQPSQNQCFPICQQTGGPLAFPHPSRARWRRRCYASARFPAGLTGEQFETLLAHLATDREQAGTRYENIHRRLVGLFAWCEAPEDIADEAINRVARRLAHETELRVENSFAYFSGVARHVAQEMSRERERERRAAAAAASMTARGPEPELETDGCYACLCACLARLPGDQRRLILEYHSGEHASRVRRRKRMAHELGISLNALRIRAWRIRRQLEMCCTRCPRNRVNSSPSQEVVYTGKRPTAASAPGTPRRPAAFR